MCTNPDCRDGVVPGAPYVDRDGQVDHHDALCEECEFTQPCEWDIPLPEPERFSEWLYEEVSI